MQDVHSVSNITNILLTIIKNEPTLQNVWVHGKISPPLSDSGTLPGHFKLEDVNNSGKFIECVIFKENAPLLAGLRVGDNVLVKGRISLHRANTSEYRFVIEDKQPFGAGPIPASVSKLLGILRSTVNMHSVKVQGKIANNPTVTQAGFCQLYLKNVNNVEMIVCVLPPNISRRPPFPLQKDTKVSIYGKFDLFTPMFQYQIKIASPNDIQLVQSDLDEDGQTIVDSVQAYLEALKTDEFSVEREHKIQFGSRNGFADVALVDGKGSFAAIAECKGTNFVGHGIEQLKSYLCATDTRFGIFANRTDPEQWEFYENRRRNQFECITSDQFKDGVVKGVTLRKQLKDQIKTLESKCNQFRAKIGDLSKEIDQLRTSKTHLKTEIGHLERRKHELYASRKQRKEKIQQFETFLADLKSDLLDSEPLPQSDDNVDPQKIRGDKKQSIMNKLKNLFSKENK